MSDHEQEALAAFYDATNARVYGLALRILGDQAAAEDITIEVYMQVQRLASSYEPDRATPSAWLWMLTRSRAIDYLRTKAAHRRQAMPLETVAGMPSTEPDPQESSVAAEQRGIVQAALATLSPAQREVIEIAYYGGLSHGEIATRLGQPLGTIKTRIRTGMMVLRDTLRPLVMAE
jgi:RNA polymerase sigma-70 factor (ECF subfamily)